METFYQWVNFKIPLLFTTSCSVYPVTSTYYRILYASVVIPISPETNSNDFWCYLLKNHYDYKAKRFVKDSYSAECHSSSRRRGSPSTNILPPHLTLTTLHSVHCCLLSSCIYLIQHILSHTKCSLTSFSAPDNTL